MKVSRIKNIVIMALVLVNLVFLSVYLLGKYTDSVARAEALTNLSELFHESGITLQTKKISEGDVLAQYAVQVSKVAEKALAEKLLGTVSEKDEGGIITTYTGEKGNAVFKSNGKFDIKLTQGAYSFVGEPRQEAERILGLLGIKADTVTTDAGGTMVTAVCAVNGTPVFNGLISFTAVDGNLMSLSGKYCPELTPSGQMADMSSAAGALMRFLTNVKGGQYACAEITAVSSGYYLTESGTLRAAWEIKTDNGTFVVDAESLAVF